MSQTPATATATEADSTPKAPYVRTAGPEDFEQIISVHHDAFVHDPVFLYFGNVQKITTDGLPEEKSVQLRKFATFLCKSCHNLGGRITVVVDPSLPNVGGREKVCAAAYWLPPNRRIETYKVPLLLKSGVWDVIKGWGLRAVKRLGLEYSPMAHKGIGVAFKQKGLKKSADDYWYLLTMMTAPDFQGKGFMSMIMREALNHAPNEVFGLEATTAKSRDQYEHLGYELMSSFKLGQGTVNAEGLPAKGPDAVGVECFTMIKSPSSDTAK